MLSSIKSCGSGLILELTVSELMLRTVFIKLLATPSMLAKKKFVMTLVVYLMFAHFHFLINLKFIRVTAGGVQ
jgi:hypothetical protein